MTEKGLEYLDFQIRQFNKRIERKILKIGFVIAATAGFMYGPPLLVLAAPIIFLTICITSSLMIVFGTWTIGMIASQDSLDFLRRLAHEEAERLRQS